MIIRKKVNKSLHVDADETLDRVNMIKGANSKDGVRTSSPLAT